MIPEFSALLALLATTIAALLTLPLVLVRRWSSPRASLAWAVSFSGVAGLILALLSGTTRLLDLATATGVVLIGGIVGSGWAPLGRRVLLFLGLAGLVAGVFARFVAFSDAVAYGPDTELATINLSWAVARSAGFVAFLAASGAIVLGARRPAQLPLGGLPARVYALHRALGITALLATAVHLLALWLDDFIEFDWAQLLLVPWTASYEPFGVTLGWFAMLCLLLTAASGALRRWLPGWRAVHAVSYLTFTLGLFHGLIAGTDAGSPFALTFYLVTLLAVGWATYRRLFAPTPPPRRAPREAPVGKTPTAKPPLMMETTLR